MSVGFFLKKKSLNNDTSLGILLNKNTYLVVILGTLDPESTEYLVC